MWFHWLMVDIWNAGCYQKNDYIMTGCDLCRTWGWIVSSCPIYLTQFAWKDNDPRTRVTCLIPIHGLLVFHFPFAVSRPGHFGNYFVCGWLRVIGLIDCHRKEVSLRDNVNQNTSPRTSHPIFPAQNQTNAIPILPTTYTFLRETWQCFTVIFWSPFHLEMFSIFRNLFFEKVCFDRMFRKSVQIAFSAWILRWNPLKVYHQIFTTKFRGPHVFVCVPLLAIICACNRKIWFFMHNFVNWDVKFRWVELKDPVLHCVNAWKVKMLCMNVRITTYKGRNIIELVWEF